MTGTDLAERLGEQGLAPSEIPAKSALFQQALDGIGTLGAATPAHAWWVPGRLEVFGKHTDYAGGRSLVATVPRGFAFVAAPRSDDEIHVLDAKAGERGIVADGPATARGGLRYVEIVATRLARNFAGSRGGANISFASDLPQAAGMSSSSALVVGVAAALARLRNLRSHRAWTGNIHDDGDLATYFACLENGQSFRELAGDSGVGTFGGSEDHTAMLMARPGRVSAFSFMPVRPQGEAALPDEWRFVISASGVAAEKTGAARDAYNRLAEGIGLLHALWTAVYPESHSLAVALESSASAPERMRDLIGRKRRDGWPPKALRNRLDHFLIEHALVMPALDAFARADAPALRTLSETSQDNAEHLLGNQVPQTIALARDARRCGAFAASSFGAGFGGSVWALVERERAAEFATDWLNRYRGRYPSLDAVGFVATPGPPLTEL